MSVEAGTTKGLTKKVTKKFMKELTDDLHKLFPHAKNGEGKIDQRLLSAWLRLHSVFKATLDPHPGCVEIQLDRGKIVIGFEASLPWEDNSLKHEISVCFFDDEGDQVKNTVKTLTKSQLLQLNAFTSSALAHHDN